MHFYFQCKPKILGLGFLCEVTNGFVKPGTNLEEEYWSEMKKSEILLSNRYIHIILFLFIALQFLLEEILMPCIFVRLGTVGQKI